VSSAPPVAGRLLADPAWRCIDLLSDVHLHADMPRTFAAWRRHLLGTPADAVLMLGDLFEVWIGDDATTTGFAGECVAVLREASRRRALFFLPGNRDFLAGDVLLASAGMQGLADPTLLDAFGQRWLLSHGDALCLDDADYQRFRTQVRSAAWQQAFLAQPLAARERQARQMRDASMAHQATQGPAGWSDVDDAEAARWLAAAGSTTLIHGHTHRPGVHGLPGGGVRHVLGDWDVDHGAPRARILRLDATGLQPLDLAAP
jgi:UDP-2,3-diacylglucosamine hydrolase